MKKFMSHFCGEPLPNIIEVTIMKKNLDMSGVFGERVFVAEELGRYVTGHELYDTKEEAEKGLLELNGRPQNKREE